MFDTSMWTLAQTTAPASEGAPRPNAPGGPTTGAAEGGNSTATQPGGPNTSAPGTPGAPGNPTSGSDGGFFGGGSTGIFLVLILVVMVVFMFSGQRKEKKKRAEMLSKMKKGNRIQTIGGILGTIVEVRDDEIIVKVDENANTRLRLARSAIQAVLEEPADKE